MLSRPHFALACLLESSSGPPGPRTQKTKTQTKQTKHNKHKNTKQTKTCASRKAHDSQVLRSTCELFTFRVALCFRFVVVCCVWCGLCYEGLVSYVLSVTHVFCCVCVCVCCVFCVWCVLFVFWFFVVCLFVVLFLFLCSVLFLSCACSAAGPLGRPQPHSSAPLAYTILYMLYYTIL